MKKMWILGLVMLALDRVSKLWAEHVLQMEGARAAWPGVFRFAYAQNTGAAFSSLSGHSGLLLAINGAMIALVMLAYLRMGGLSRVTRAGMILIVLGGLGNIIDRAVYGYVIDFIELLFVRFAIFNVADVMVTLGAGLAIAGLFAKEGRK